MFYLAQKELPSDEWSLAAALKGSLDQIFLLPARKDVVSVEGGSDGYPSFTALRVDLSGAKVEFDEPPRKMETTGKRVAGPRVKQFELLGRPIRYQDAAVDVELTTRDAHFEYALDRDGGSWLLLNKARDGHVEIQISHDDLENLLLKAAQAAAAKHGVQINEVRVKLTQQASQRDTVAAAIVVTARKLLSAIIHIDGQLKIDDELNAKLSKLSCSGEGMIGSLVCGFIRPHLERIDNRKFSLMKFSLGEVRLRDLEVRVEQESLSVKAQFGS